MKPGSLFAGFLALAGVATFPAAQEPIGNVETIAATCALCHGPDGEGAPGMEGLTDFSRAEFIEEMHELPEEPGEYRLMSVLVRAYSDAEIRALADHFARKGEAAE